MSSVNSRGCFFQHCPVLLLSTHHHISPSLLFKIRIQSVSHHPSLTPLFPVRFSFPLNSLTLSPPRTHTSHTHTPRYLICGLGSQFVALWFSSRHFLCHREPWVQNLYRTNFHECKKSVPSMLCPSQWNLGWINLGLGDFSNLERELCKLPYLSSLSTAVTVKSVGLSRHLLKTKLWVFRSDVPQMSFTSVHHAIFLGA